MFSIIGSISNISQRSKRAAFGSLAIFAARGFSFIGFMVIGAILPSYLGAERFGLWMVITSFTALASFADLGLGLGLLNPLAESFARGDLIRARALVANAFYSLLAISGALIFLTLIFSGSIPWAEWLGVHDGQAKAETGLACMAMILCFLVGLPAGIGGRIQVAGQRTHRAALFDLIGSTLSVLGVLVVAWSGGDVLGLILVGAGIPVAVAWLNTILEFNYNQCLKPCFRLIDSAQVSEIFTKGFSFFLLQIGGIAFIGVDGILLSSAAGNSAAGEYALLVRLFGLISVPVSIVVAPLWPAYADARARGDVNWIASTLRRMMIGAVLFSFLGCLSLLLASPWFVPWWTGGVIRPSGSLIGAVGFWSFIWGVGNVVGVFLNAMNIVKFQVYLMLISMPIIVFLKFIGAHFFEGLGLALATSMAYLICIPVPTFIVVRRLLQRMAGGVKTRSI